MFQRIPMLQRCLSTARSWEKLSQGLRDESRPEHRRHFEVSFPSHPILGRPEERLQEPLELQKDFSARHQDEAPTPEEKKIVFSLGQLKKAPFFVGAL